MKSNEEITTLNEEDMLVKYYQFLRSDDKYDYQGVKPYIFLKFFMSHNITENYDFINI